MHRTLDVAAALADAAHDARTPEDLDRALTTIALIARDSVTDIDHVGILVLRQDGIVESRAATDPLVAELDRIQQGLGEGPGLDALKVARVVRVAPAVQEVRWTGFMAEALRRGVCAQLAVRLQSGPTTLGVLSGYSVTSDVISQETQQQLQLVAAHASLALSHLRQVENLTAALVSRRVIGLALGLVMERHDLDEDTAFSYLTRLSATTETKLRDVAAGVVADHHARIRRPDQS